MLVLILMALFLSSIFIFLSVKWPELIDIVIQGFFWGILLNIFLPALHWTLASFLPFLALPFPDSPIGYSLMNGLIFIAVFWLLAKRKGQQVPLAAVIIIVLIMANPYSSYILLMLANMLKNEVFLPLLGIG